MARSEIADLDLDALRALWPNAPLVVEARALTGSTQDDAREAAKRGAPHGSIFVADAQTHGRGRQGRVWTAPPGSALLASVLLHPRVAPETLPRLSLVVGIVIARACARRVTRDVGIKWPNDVEIERRKVSGVLVEAAFRGTDVSHVVAGFGVNLRRASLPDELRLRATSLEEAGATDLDRGAFLVDVVRDLLAAVASFERDGLAAFLEELRARDVARGRAVEGESVRGVASGIDDDGRLVVETAAGRVPVHAGEVRFT